MCTSLTSIYSSAVWLYFAWCCGRECVLMGQWCRLILRCLIRYEMRGDSRRESEADDSLSLTTSAHSCPDHRSMFFSEKSSVAFLFIRFWICHHSSLHVTLCGLDGFKRLMSFSISWLWGQISRLAQHFHSFCFLANLAVSSVSSAPASASHLIRF